ncbi:Protein lava lamp [Frankliniella fusca]|uniref:Protein lava lamp n=1 Tax=Frankliniella fusca TaxID=407009 RepID=A0AAE1GS44_9NEOP|nr:Protein lava lamp [Frankliniella fusca]
MEEPESYPVDSEDMLEQIEQQRTLATQLREKLEQDELQLASKEQQNEILKSKLSLLKSRTKSKRSLATKDEKNTKAAKEQSGSPQNPGKKAVSNSASKGKINILREQLEQNRLRFERHGLELSEDTRSMEAMVEQLRHELEERDVTIQQLQEGQELPLPLNSEANIAETRDLPTQLLKKEQEVMSLSTQVTELQNTVLELQENLKEKDCVIEARTQAISLLSEDMSRKWRSNVDMLEETRQQMQMMQENFVRIETGLKAEIEQLNLQLENNSKKLSQAEQNVRDAEAARNELLCKNDELLAELKKLQDMPKTDTGLEQANVKVKELTEALSEANKLTVKLKAEHKTKVKTLNKQIDSLRKESDLSGQMIQLQNHIAELEEEKGNLQLLLLEIEEGTANQDQKISELQAQILELQNQKFEAEMKLVEWEEQKSSNESAEQEIAVLKLKLEDIELENQMLKETINRRELLSKDEIASNFEKRLEEAQSSIKEWQNRFKDLQRENQVKSDAQRHETILVEDQTAALSSFEEKLKHKVDVLEQSVFEKQAQVQELQAIVQASLEKIEDLTHATFIEKACENCNSLTRRLQEQEAQISALESSITILKNDSLKLKQIDVPVIPVQGDQYEGQPPICDETIAELQRQLIEVSGELELKREECARLDSKLKVQVEKAKKLAVNLKVKTVANKDLEDKASKFETLLQSSKVEFEQLERERLDMLEKWQLEVSEKDTNLSQATEALASKGLEVLNLQEELRSKTAALAEIQGKFDALQNQAEKLQSLADERLGMLDNLNRSNAEQAQQMENIKFVQLQTELNSMREQLNSESEEKLAAVTKLENITTQAKIKLAKEKKLRLNLLQKQEELEALLAEKNNALEEIQRKHALASEYYQQEQERFEKLLKDQQEQVASLHQKLEQEVNKLQYANETVNIEEVTEEAQDLQYLLSAESFQNEIENLCASAIYSTPMDVLPLLQDEKTKTMNELGTSFESLHSQIVERLQNRPDVHADRKLFSELKNLVKRVINRTAALESKIRNIVAESDSLIQNKLLDAEKSIQVLEHSLSEARVMLDEKSKLESDVNNLNKERFDLSQKLQEEVQKSLNLEAMLSEAHSQMNTLVQNTSSLQAQIIEKDNVIQHLQAKYQSATDQCNVIHQELTVIMQDNDGLKSNLENLKVDNETLKSKLLSAEQELHDNRIAYTELQTSSDNTKQRCEFLQRQLDESSQQGAEVQIQLQRVMEEKDNLHEHLANLQLQLTESRQKYSDLQLQLQESLKEREGLQHQLGDAVSSISELQQELLEKTKTHSIALSENSNLLSDASSSKPSEQEEALRQQLIEKTAEVENYQRRLIQLQMGAPDPISTPTFSFHTNSDQASEVSQVSEEVSYQKTNFLDQNNSSHSSTTLDAFKPASSFFEMSPEVNSELRLKLENMTEQLELLKSEKKSLELQVLSLQSTLDNVNGELIAAREEVESMYPTLSGLQTQVSELTISLDASQANVQQEKDKVKKLEGTLEEMKCKLETAQFGKENAESELEIRAQKEAEERPDIPQSLDTHVFSLQDSGSGFSNEDVQQSSTVKTDEYVMESNITQLESELRGMVMSRQDSLLKQKAMEGFWDSENNKPIQPERQCVIKEGEEKGTRDELSVELGSLKSEVCELKEKIIQLESEKIKAESQINELQAELQKHLQSRGSSSIDHNALSVADSFINEDDTWGWGADSAHIEVQHQHLKTQIEPISESLGNELQLKIELLQSANETLEKEKVQLADDLKASQIRAAKLTRKLRDLKSKYDEVSDKSRATDSPFDSLDQAIEEERMKQVQGLERELKEVQAELNAFKAERDRLQKQVEVFSSANERMLEIKERQDVEVEMWQKRSNDLTNQVQAMEWKIRELEDGKKGKSEDSIGNTSKLSLPTELNSLEVDQLLKENHTWNSNYENLMQEYQKLRAQCLADSEQRSQIETLVSQQKGMIERLEHEKTYFQDVYDSLKMDYESACAQLASKQIGQDESTHFLSKRCEELEEKLMSAEERLQETAAELQKISSESAVFQAQCSQLDDAKKELMLQLEHNQIKMEADALEISQLRENIKASEVNSSTSLAKSQSIPVPVQEELIQHESASLNLATSSSVLNWNSVVPGIDLESADIFESIASNTTKALEEQIALKENESQKDKRMIETLKRTMEESGQEWSQLIEYQKNQLEAAQTTINGLQSQLEVMKQSSFSKNDSQDLELVYNQQAEKCQELESIIFSKDKEIEALQINLSVCEESKKKLEEELCVKKAVIEKLMTEISLRSVENMSRPESQPAAFIQASNPSMVLPNNISAMSSGDRNLSNELDLALCMLHERDVRCEELTLELTQLLEERDGLQLRLSNAIRTNEELRERLKQLLSTQANDSNMSSSSIIQRVDETVPNFYSENSYTASPPTFISSVNPETYTVDLQNKLTEIRKIGYSHDKRLKEDSEYRHQQQMRLMSSSPTSSLSGNSSEVASLISETTPTPEADTISIRSNSDVNNAEQSSSNDSQGSILDWFWGRN